MSMVLAGLVVMLTALTGAAQDRLDAVAAGVDRAITPATESTAVERMATFLGTTPETLRTERTTTRLPWGDVFISHRIATRGGHPIEKVFAARRTGATWEQIASEARVEPDALVQDVTTLWPDAARARASEATTSGTPAPTNAAEEKKGMGRRVMDFLRGSPSETTGPAAPDDKDRAQEEIRDRMIRGGGARSR